MTLLTHAFLADLDAATRRSLTRRSAVPNPSIRAGAWEICEEVRTGGETAVSRLAHSLGGGFEKVTSSAIDAATARVDTDVRRALESAADAIRTFHLSQLPSDLTVTTIPGVEITRRWTPLRRVGAYVPGGKAIYPSTVLMTVVPAVAAQVPEIVVVSPADGPRGPSDVSLAACKVAGATEVWRMGGAQAIAALAYGTESIAPVEKIVGPGNSWVTAAKLAVYGVCDVDLPAGPSEVLVVADRTADPHLVAVDLLCQAEHGPDSPALLVTTDPDLPDKVETELARLLPDLDRRDILGDALAAHGWALVAPDMETALEFTNEYAPEHVSIATDDPERDAKSIRSAGSVYVGRWAPESAGDYATGANHVLPTGGMAASCGPLSVEDFGSWRQEQRLTRDGLRAIAPTIGALASAEGLTAHRLAADARLEKETNR